jgi:hypothetical protein
VAPSFGRVAPPRHVVRVARGIGVAVAVSIVFAAPAQASAPTSTTPQVAAAGGIGIRLVASSTSAGNEPEGRIYVVDHVAPGAVIHRQVQVSNSTGSTVHIVLYAAAASMANDSFIGAVGHTSNAVSTWTSIHPSSSDVPVRGMMTANVTISVPSTAAAGEHYGVIWAETRSTPVNDGIIEVSRVGVRIYLAVGAGGLTPANFSIGSLSAMRSSVGQTTIHTVVRNTGGWPLDVSGTLRLTDGPGGLSASPLPVRLVRTLSAGDSQSIGVALNNNRIPAGRWHIRMSLQGGGLERSAAASLMLPGPTSHFGWLFLAIGLVVLFGIAALLVDRRIRRPRPSDRSTRCPLCALPHHNVDGRGFR